MSRCPNRRSSEGSQEHGQLGVRSLFTSQSNLRQTSSHLSWRSPFEHETNDPQWWLLRRVEKLTEAVYRGLARSGH